MTDWRKCAALGLLLATPFAGELAAAPACFQDKDIEADQGIRFQTDVMVLSDACGVDSYQRFATRNRDAIMVYRNQMVDHYRRGGDRRPEDSLDRFMTGLANQMSLENGGEPLPALCARRAAFLSDAAALNRDQFQHRVADLAVQNARSYKKCSN